MLECLDSFTHPRFVALPKEICKRRFHEPRHAQPPTSERRSPPSRDGRDGRDHSSRWSSRVYSCGTGCRPSTCTHFIFARPVPPIALEFHPSVPVRALSISPPTFARGTANGVLPQTNQCRQPPTTGAAGQSREMPANAPGVRLQFFSNQIIEVIA